MLSYLTLAIPAKMTELLLVGDLLFLFGVVTVGKLTRMALDFIGFGESGDGSGGQQKAGWRGQEQLCPEVREG
ncbi:hypothetical protein ACTG1K_10010 [Aeromonas sp. 102P]